MSDSDEILIHRDESLAVITLNRPKCMNAITSGMLELLSEELPRLTADRQIRAILITGAGRAFCAGGDVGNLGGASREATIAGMGKAQAVVRAALTGDKPVVTAVNGPAAGGGFGLAMLGDIILASEAAVFKGGFTSLGGIVSPN